MSCPCPTSWWLPAVPGLQLDNASLCPWSHDPLSWISLPFQQGYLSLDLEPTLNLRQSHLKSLNYISKSFFQIVTYTGSGGLGLGAYLLGATIHPTVGAPSTELSCPHRSTH